MTTMSVGMVSPAITTDSTLSSPLTASMPFPKRMWKPLDSRYSRIFSPMSGSRFRGNGGGLLLVT